MDWNIQNAGHVWTGDEVRQRYEMTLEKIELIEGKLFWSDEDRVRMLALVFDQCSFAGCYRVVVTPD